MMMNERAKQELQAMRGELLGKTISLAEAAAKRGKAAVLTAVRNMTDEEIAEALRVWKTAFEGGKINDEKSGKTGN